MKIKYCYLLLLVTVISGCQRIGGYYLPDDIVDTRLNNEVEFLVNDGDSYLIDISKVITRDNTKENRNQFISTAMAMSDKRCALHEAQIIANSTTWNIITGSTSILLAGTASVLTHAQTAADLAAGAAATSGIQSLVNKEAYADKLATAIIRAIDISRNKARLELKNGITQTIDDYPLAQAISDVQVYHNSCSLMAGLVELSSALDNRIPSANEIKNQIKDLEMQRKNLESSGFEIKNQTALEDELVGLIKAKYQLLAK